MVVLVAVEVPGKNIGVFRVRGEVLSNEGECFVVTAGALRGGDQARVSADLDGEFARELVLLLLEGVGPDDEGPRAEDLDHGDADLTLGGPFGKVTVRTVGCRLSSRCGR
ncbi:hypothetical protein [Cryobacterium sp. GrIS_2_6]|uniref:hypothetical protein n=1 Tax=Cryobacterium sp. GrIS_2_6 TaxID=3162785 RepID=UPI0034DCF2B8